MSKSQTKCRSSCTRRAWTDLPGYLIAEYQHRRVIVKTIAASFLTASAILLGGEMSSQAQAQSPGTTVTVPSASGAGAAQHTRAQQLMGDFAPKLAELTDNVLFGDVWERPDFRNATAVSSRSAP